jgi:hypothetical protein
VRYAVVGIHPLAVCGSCTNRCTIGLLKYRLQVAIEVGAGAGN